ncbi:glycoside hydrolase family 31 protein [Hymenobacter ginsengisoli]|uniref:Glycoside hydrolase family 31 protein n=1 Tax=Hymenobacter ginsengisoli TaxID=1051626 RepID=A0ABP8Q2F4_9BACT|nr:MULTISPECIES: TIM-barrel domain-containing protein [unclassified Hymenobacter]MBO2032413.1 glycoside hydrolase family 31 protein [Hymenobacter sp. BT559]
MTKYYALLASLLLANTSGWAQSYQRTSQGLKASLETFDVEIRFYSPQIVRVLKTPKGGPPRLASLSVIKEPQATALTLASTDSTVTLTSQALRVRLGLRRGNVAIDQAAGAPLLHETRAAIRFRPNQGPDAGTYAVRQAFRLAPDEVIYGLGQQQNGKLNQRGQRVRLAQHNTSVAIPFFQSAKGYGIFWDNYSPTTFADTLQETSFASEVGRAADYYVLYGGTTDGVVAQLRELTGQAPLMPLWVYGFSQSRERYKTQVELVDVVKRYRALGVPLDGIVQDWQYWGKDDNWNAMSFDPATFPRPQQMVDSVHLLKAHLFIVAWPGFAPKTPQYQEFASKNMLLNFDTWPPGANTKPYDVYNPAARAIYWRYLNKGIFSLGPDAWWLDSTEPDHINEKPTDFDQPTHLGTYRSVQNAFPLQHVRGVYEHQRATSEAKRVMLLTRSAFAGQQRYGSNTWSGDVGSSFETLKKQVPAALNFSLTGLPYWNADIGGFFAGSFKKDGGAKNPAFQELYVRWMQFATFTPMMRSHGTDIPREIYQFGQRGDWAFDVQEQFINLRYRLLPYLYGTAWQVTSHGGSIMRPLAAAFGRDRASLDQSGEFLFGQSFLVAPVTEAGTKTKSVYLPAGATWYDFWTGQRLTGGQTVARACPIELLPVYVRAGAIVPWGPKVQYAGEKKWDHLEIRVYPGANGEFTLYEDEGDSYRYEKGARSEITFRWDDAKRQLTIQNRQGSFPGMLARRTFRLALAGPQNGAGVAPAKVVKAVSYASKQLVVKL